MIILQLIANSKSIGCLKLPLSEEEMDNFFGKATLWPIKFKT
jgi:hypothetical protein